MATINRAVAFSGKGKFKANGSIAPVAIDVGTQPISTHFNRIAGSSVKAAASASAALNKIGYLWGIGYGDRGYGQSTFPIYSRQRGSNISADDWQNLLSAGEALKDWQGAATTLIASTEVDAGELIEASHPTSFIDPIDILDGGRLNFQLENMTLTANAATTIRSSVWGTQDLTAIFAVKFDSENDARFFFNTGGQLRITFDHATGGPNTGVNTGWSDILSNVSLSFSAHDTTMPKDGWGYSNEIGYYELTTNWQTIMWAQNTSLYVRGAQDILVEARSNPVHFKGKHGAKGSLIEFRVTLESIDATLYQENMGTDGVGAGTSAFLSYLKATTGLSVASPTCYVSKGF